MCCGETLEQREQGVTMDFIRQQVKVGFQNVTADQAKTAVIAYEQSGQLEQVRQQQPSRLKKYAQVFVHASLKSMMMQQQQLSVSSTADL